MSIRLKNLDLNTPGMKRTVTANFLMATGTTQFPIFVAPVAARVETIDVFFMNGFSGNTSNTLQINVAPVGSSGSTLQVFTINTSAGTNAYSAGQQVRLTPSANNSLTVGTALFMQISSVCQAVPSQSFVITTYTPLTHRETR